MIYQIYKEEGWRGYFRGLTSTCAREIPGYYCFFLIYEAATRWLGKNREQSVESLGELKFLVYTSCQSTSEAYCKTDLPQEIEVANFSLIHIGTWPFARLESLSCECRHLIGQQPNLGII